MARYECARCGQVCHTTDPEHICKDIAQRLARRNKQVRATIGILNEMFPHPDSNDELRQAVAERIVSVLANLGVDEE